MNDNQEPKPIAPPHENAATPGATQDTLALIFAEMRIFKCRNLETGELELCNAIANYFADRLEAALKREREASGNAAAMREALVAVKKSIDDIGESSLDCDPTILMAALTQVCARLSARIERALFAPPRNCDAGTPEEQAKRFEEFCNSHTCTMDCKVHESWRHFFHDCGLEKVSCGLIFAQMPYESGVVK